VALGAARTQVLTKIMQHGLQVTVGCRLGLAGALAPDRLIGSLLFGVQPTDTVTIAVVIGDDYGRGGRRELVAGVAGLATGHRTLR
jgi:hypothetical protein